MSTTTAVTTTSHNIDTTGSNLSTEKVTSRAYAKLKEDGEIDKIVAKAESANQENWKKLEASGHVQWSSNEFVKYIVKTMQGFELLVPDEEQRLYIIQSGLNYVQNSKVNGFMVERQEADQALPKYNNETIDLRESINIPPEKRALTDSQKLERLIKSLGLSPAESKSLLDAASANYAAQATSSTSIPEEESSEEEVTA
jgi:hypothetical protein